MAEGPDLAARISTSIKKLASSAASLNRASDEFGTHAIAVDAALRKLNIGIEVWEVIREIQGSDGITTNHYVGFSRIKGTWGLALSVATFADGELMQDENWAFNEGPRHLRIDAIEKLPELLERISTEAEKAAKKLESSIAIAQSISKAVLEAVDDAKVKRGGAR